MHAIRFNGAIYKLVHKRLTLFSDLNFCFISGGSKGGGAFLFLDETEARRADIKFFGDRPPPLSQGLDDCAPPPPLSEGLDPPLFTAVQFEFFFYSSVICQ